jgi:hypothetical protein
MKYWERFKSMKQRGEWVELQFMAQAANRRFAVCKPWGETHPYDVGIEHGPNFLRVQVKSTTHRVGAGYCQCMPNHQNKHDYTLTELDLFAAYVIPVDAWYLIPAALLLGERRITGVVLSQSCHPRRRRVIATNATGMPGACSRKPAANWLDTAEEIAPLPTQPWKSGHLGPRKAPRTVGL